MAGGANFGDEEESISDINVTPLVDIMLVLLIIFMVTANYINNQAINLNLPKAATGESPESTNLGFAISKDSELFLDGESISYEQISELIERKKQEGKGAIQALISADRETPHGDVVKLIDEVRKNGIEDFAINIEVEAGGASTQ